VRDCTGAQLRGNIGHNTFDGNDTSSQRLYLLPSLGIHAIQWSEFGEIPVESWRVDVGDESGPPLTHTWRPTHPGDLENDVTGALLNSAPSTAVGDRRDDVTPKRSSTSP